MKFKTRTREIEAEQFLENGPVVKGVCLCGRMAMGPHVHTMHEGQQVRLMDGDWVTAEPDGEHYYPIKSEVMVKNYEPV